MSIIEERLAAANIELAERITKQEKLLKALYTRIFLLFSPVERGLTFEEWEKKVLGE
jgi:hypothetical protein